MDSWFTEETSRAFVWFALLSMLSGVDGIAKAGRFRRPVIGVWLAVLVFGVACLGAMIVAILHGQPNHVVRPLLVCGVVLTCVFGATYPTLIAAYRDAELRRMCAQDL